MTDRKFYKRVVRVEILSEDPIGEVTLETIAEQVMTGDWDGWTEWEDLQEMNGKEAAEALISHQADPEFFGLTEDGREIDEEEREGDGPGASYIRNAGTCVGGEEE